MTDKIRFSHHICRSRWSNYGKVVFYLGQLMEAILLVFSQSVTRAPSDLFCAAKEIGTSNSQNHCSWGSYRLNTFQ